MDSPLRSLMSAYMPPPRYVIERMYGVRDPFHDHDVPFVALWQSTGSTPWPHLIIFGGDTVTEVKERMSRMYPLAECAAEPEETAAVLRAAADAMKGATGGDHR